MMAQTNGPGPQNDTPERTGTVLETDEDIRQALIAGPKEQQQRVPVEPVPDAGRPASPFRQTVRLSTPILTIFDDGKTDDEVIRLRLSQFVIGRAEGALRFPMDGRMSARHVEITHQDVGGLHRWVVTDLQSTHGTFVRVRRTALADKAEFLVGNGRYRFEASQPERDATVDHLPGEPASGETQGWTEGAGSLRPPALTEVLGREIGNRVLLIKGEYSIGSAPTCPICRPDDPFCEARHVRVFRDQRGGWCAEHNRTQNGLWLRMTQITVESTVQFQVGEQRFKLKVS
jgi:pSer/pThr/pTyr-binding forkhead associated (FHA) protein